MPASIYEYLIQVINITQLSSVPHLAVCCFPTERTMTLFLHLHVFLTFIYWPIGQLEEA